MARALQGKIVTNDFNLNKVAQLRGVEVLNINELANSLKPVVLPGEIMKVFILKEGKEYNQGVAYLDDGTMVVVDNARKMIGKTIDVVVTSVLQTTAGKMIFGRFIDAAMAAQADASSATPDPSLRRRCRGGGIARSRARAKVNSFDLSNRPFHWWRTVFFLIPAISLYTIVLGTLSLASSLFETRGYFAHWCARTWSRLILLTTGVSRARRGLERLRAEAGRTSSSRTIRASTTSRPVCSLPYQLRIIAKESLGSFPFLGWHLRRTGHMLVDRRRPDRAADLRVGVPSD